MIGIRGGHKAPRLDGEQVVRTHEASNSFAVHYHPAATQFRRNPARTVPAAMSQRDLLNGRPNLHIFFQRRVFLQRPIEARAADFGQLAHTFHTQAALHGHQLSDLLEDTVSPELPLLRRRASTFCKAPLKKSASSVFSPSTRFRSQICLRSSRSWELEGGSFPSSMGSI